VKSSVTGNPEIAKQDTLVPSTPLQLHFQGPMPEPETDDAVPPAQSPAVGAVETWTAVAGPHWLEVRLSAQTADEISGRIETDIPRIRQVVRHFWRSLAFVLTMFVHRDQIGQLKPWFLLARGAAS
jgi:hypothetical protein